MGSSHFIMSSRAVAEGKGTRIRFSRRRRSAWSSSHGRLEAARTKTCSAPESNPSICVNNSVFIRREPSCSPASPRADMRASISSMKIVDGAWWRASSKRTRTSFSESPRHFETIDDALMLKKVVRHSVATAFASSVLPVPGGP